MSGLYGNVMLPREGLGAEASIIEVLLYSLLTYCFSHFFCYLFFSKEKQKKRVLWWDFMIIFLINFLIFYACLIADLVRGWSFLKFAIVIFPLVFFVDGFFLLSKLLYGKEVVSWGVIFLISLFVILPLIIVLRKSLWGLPKLK